MFSKLSLNRFVSMNATINRSIMQGNRQIVQSSTNGKHALLVDTLGKQSLFIDKCCSTSFSMVYCTKVMRMGHVVWAFSSKANLITSIIFHPRY